MLPTNNTTNKIKNTRPVGNLGSRNIKNLFEEERKDIDQQNESRNDVLESRNEAIAHRAYYYLHIKKHSYDYVIDILRKEFWLSPISLGRIISANLDVIKRLLNEKATVEVLRERIDHLSWEDA